jgi:hypothetical protein
MVECSIVRVRRVRDVGISIVRDRSFDALRAPWNALGARSVRGVGPACGAVARNRLQGVRCADSCPASGTIPPGPGRGHGGGGLAAAGRSGGRARDRSGVVDRHFECADATGLDADAVTGGGRADRRPGSKPCTTTSPTRKLFDAAIAETPADFGTYFDDEVCTDADDPVELFANGVRMTVHIRQSHREMTDTVMRLGSGYIAADRVPRLGPLRA